jgi:hypothetical protein
MSLWSKIADVFASNEGSSTKLDLREHIQHIVMTSGLTNERPEDVDFYVDAYESKRLNPRDVCKFGTLLTTEEKAAIGLPVNTIVAREFVSTLNEQGLADPEGTAFKIARAAAHRCHVAVSLLKMRQSGVTLARFRASTLAAGPCPHAAKQDGARMAVRKATLLPFDDCSHPEQCSCHYQSWQNIADDMGDMMV